MEFVKNNRSLAGLRSNAADQSASLDGNLINTPLLTQYMRTVVRWKWVILGAIAATLVLGLIITLLMTPRYTAISRIEISREQDKIVKVEGVEQDNNAANIEFY